MPGYTIHIAIAKEYIKNHPNEITNKKEFYRGNIFPDLTDNKDKTHYGKWSNFNTKIHIEKFISDKNVDLAKDFWKGYFLHLYSDKKFINEYFYEEFMLAKKNNEKFYKDYDLLEKEIRKLYNIEKEDYPKEVNLEIKYKNGELKYLKISKIQEMIKKLSKINIEDEIKLIKKEGNL